MSTTEILPFSFGPRADAIEPAPFRVYRSGVVIDWQVFRLSEPRPAESLEDLADIEAARRALAEPGAPVPYEDVRRELGLA